MAVQALIDKQLDSSFSDSDRRKSLDSTYNCHGMVYANRMGFIGIDDTIPKGVITSPSEQEFEFDSDSAQKNIIELLEGNGMKVVANVPNITICNFDAILPKISRGDVVTYLDQGKITHSCVIYTAEKINSIVNIKVLSKLGTSSGEYFHTLNDTAVTKMHGTHVKIWTDR